MAIKEILILDSKKRAAEKQAARDKDQADLDAGLVTPAELNKRNGFFSALDLGSFTIEFAGRNKLKIKKSAS
jgi:hypothetical protein